jgi:hypothetical protein
MSTMMYFDQARPAFSFGGPGQPIVRTFGPNSLKTRVIGGNLSHGAAASCLAETP